MFFLRLSIRLTAMVTVVAVATVVGYDAHNEMVSVGCTYFDK